jgi:hypothetical protein
MQEAIGRRITVYADRRQKKKRPYLKNNLKQKMARGVVHVKQHAWKGPVFKPQYHQTTKDNEI